MLQVLLVVLVLPRQDLVLLLLVTGTGHAATAVATIAARC
eukprot:SAG11_NODE_36742_length_260_cov_0.639752_1_plen_40_part_10